MSEAPPELESALGAIREQVEAELDRRLPESPRGDPTRLHEALRYSALGAGKRMRPALCVLAAEACGGDRARALPAGAALELIHAYSLVHDDLPAMDDDALRRGRPTSHVVYGEALAVLVGDGLQTAAFETLTRAYAEDPPLAVDLVRLLAAAAGAEGMVGGQALDVTAELPRTEEALEGVHRKKTGALLRAAVLMGARAAGVREGEPRWDPLDRYARALGLAFQVADDVLDATASTAELGKTAGKDAEQDKLTYVALLGLEGAQAKAAGLDAEARASLESFGVEADLLRALAGYVVARSR